MKFKFLLFLSIIVCTHAEAKAQLTDALFFGDILFSEEESFATKKKEMTGLQAFSPAESLFGTVFLKIKMKSHTAFKSEGDQIMTTLTLTAETGEQTTLDLTFDKGQENDKSACFEIVPKVPNMENPNHLKLAGFLGKLPASVSSLTFTIGNQRGELIRTDGYVIGRVRADLSNGIGNFQPLKDEQDRLDQIAEEERLAKAAEEKRLAEERAALRKKTRDEYFNASDAVSISFKNTCNHYGTVRISTGNEFTNQSAGVEGQRQTGSYTCRPGDKVYNSDGKLLHTISSSSRNKVLSFCPPKTREMIDEEDFQEGRKRISITVINSCSDTKVYYNHQSGASTSKTWMGSNSRTSLSLRKGDKLWIADENGNNVSIIFEPVSYSQDRSDVYLCR